jgi:hypothetical protein
MEVPGNDLSSEAAARRSADALHKPFGRNLAKYYLARPETHCVLVAELDGRMVGIFAGYVAEYPFSFERLALNAFVYVRPESRGFI